MSNQPLNSSDQSKILIFGLLMLPSIVFLVGIIPILFLVFGLFMMKKDEDFSHITTATQNFRGYVHLVLAGCIIFGLICAVFSEYDGTLGAFLLFVCCIPYLFFVTHLFINPLSNHREWVRVNGIFSSKPKNTSNTVVLGEVDTIKGENTKQYSEADELIKWVKLKEDGHISESEFNKAKEKILKRT